MNLKKGDVVRVAATGLSYKYLGTDGLVGLGVENYLAAARWEYVPPALTAVETGSVWQLVSGNETFLITKLGTGAAAKYLVSRPTIDAIAVAASAAIGFGGSTGLALAGAGAFARNTVLGKANAYVDGSSLTSGGDVDLEAESTASISATIVAASIALGAGVDAGIGASIGVAISENFIGARGSGGSRLPMEVRAYVRNSAIQATGDLTQTALADQKISALVIAASGALGAAGSVGIGASGAGSIATNTIIVDVEASITGDGDPAYAIHGISAASVTLKASDTSKIKALAIGASIAAGFAGIAGIAVSVAVTLARNEIDNRVTASISGVSSGVRSVGDVTLTADGTAAIESLAVAASVALSGATVAASLSGAGAEATNVILTRTNSFVSASDVTTTGSGAGVGDVALRAQNDSSIRAIVAAASAAVSGGIVAVGGSIGVSLSRNQIGGVPCDGLPECPAEVRAYIESSTVDAAGDLTVRALAGGTIAALVLAISVAIAGGGVGIAATGAGSRSDNRISTHVKAFVAGTPGAGTTVDADSVLIEATDTSSITANVAAASIGVAAGIGAVTISISVSLARNHVANDVGAYITGVTRLETRVGSVSVTASTGAAPLVTVSDPTLVTKLNDAIIDAGEVPSPSALKAALPTLGLSDVLAVTSLIDNTEWVLRDVGNGRAYVIRRTDAGFAVYRVTIDAVTVAASIAVGAGGIAGAASGAGGVATNVILSTTNASIEGSSVTSAGDVTLRATSTSAIVATIVSVSVAAGIGAGAGAALSIGVAIAHNLIGWDPDGSTPDHRLSDGTRTVQPGQTVLIDAGPLTGGTYRYIGAATLTNVLLATQDFTDTSKWRELRTLTPVEVQAFIVDSSVDAAGALTLEATSHQTIAAIVVAGSVAVAGGGVFGIGATGAGSSAENRISVIVGAFIDGDGADGIEADAIALTATDTSTIKADVGTGSLGGGFGALGAAVSIAVALADNQISNQVRAFIADADTGVTARAGGVAISATEAASISALSVGVSAAVGGGLVGLSISGAGAAATNAITNSVQAFVSDSKLTATGTTDAAGDVTIEAQDTSRISALILAVSVAVAGGGVAAVGVSIGASVASNRIGWIATHISDDFLNPASGADTLVALVTGDLVRVARTHTAGGTPGALYRYVGGAAQRRLSEQNYGSSPLWELVADDADVKAYVKDSSISASGDLTIEATASQSIRAVTAAGSAAVAAGAVGVAASGAGASATNAIGVVVQAYIDGDGATGISARSVELTALDVSSITAITVAASVAASFAPSGAAVSVAVAISRNDVGSLVEAYIVGADAGVTATAGVVALSATSRSDAVLNSSNQPFVLTTVTRANLDAAAAAQADDPDSPGAAATATLTALRNAFPASAPLPGDLTLFTITPGQAWQLVSSLGYAYLIRWDADTTRLLVTRATITAHTVAASISGGLAGIAAGGASATNTYATRTRAFIDGGSVVTASGDVSVTASDTASIAAFLPSVSVSVGVIVSATAVSVTHNTIRSRVEAAIGTGSVTSSAGSITVTATSLLTAHASTLVVAVGGGIGAAVGVANARIEVGGHTIASVGRATLKAAAGAVAVAATSTIDASSVMRAGSGSAVAVTASDGNVSIDHVTRASVGEGAHLTVGGLTVHATGTSTATAQLSSGSGGLVAVNAGAAKTIVAGTVEAYVGPTGDATLPLDQRTTIDATGDVDIQAKSGQFAKSTSGGGSGGGVSVQALTVDAKTYGTTRAFVGDAVLVELARDLRVAAEITGAAALANVVMGGGGVIAIGSDTAIARSTPTVDAHIGKDVSATLTRDLLVTSTGRAESDALAQNDGGGGISVAVAYAEAVVFPTVTAGIGTGTVITAGRDVTVTTELKSEPAEDPPSDEILAVNVTDSTATFKFPLRSGDVVTYDSSGSAIGGLFDGRTYNVSVVGENTIAFESTFSVSSVDALSDLVVFSTPHNFHSGDAVHYRPDGGLSIVEPWQTALPTTDPRYVNPSGLLYVRGVLLSPDLTDATNVVTDPTKIDPLRIRLVRTPEAAVAAETTLLKPFDAVSGVNATTDKITLPGDPFDEGDAVTYHAAALHTFRTEWTDVTIGMFAVCGRTTDPPTHLDIARTCNAANPNDPTNGRVIHADNDNIFLPGHGFNSGDAVVYRNVSGGPGLGLVHGTTYYVIRLNENAIRLANTYFEAVGRDFQARGDGADDDITQILVTPRELTPSSALGDQDDVHSLTRALTNLEHGRTYYVVGYDYDADAGQATFGLALTRNGTPIQLNGQDTIAVFQRNGAFVENRTFDTRRGTHRVGSLGIDLRTGTDATEALRLALTSFPAGTHRLLGPGGVPLSTVSPPPGDGISGATAQGGTGGFGDINVPTAKVRASSSVVTSVDATSITAARDVSIEARAVTNVTTYANASGGGALTVGEAHADTLVGQGSQTVTDPAATLASPALTEVKIGSDTTITAGDDLTLLAASDHTLSATAKSLGGGVISAKIAETTATLSYVTRTTVGANATLVAGDVLTVRATSSAAAKTDSETYSVALGAGADSDDTNGDRGAIIAAQTLVTVNSGAQLEGLAVVIEALVTKLDGHARARATSYSPIFFGVVTAFARAKVDITSTAAVDLIGSETRITGWRGVDIRAIQRGITVTRDAWHLAVALIPPQNAFAEGAITLTTKVNSDSGLLVTVGARDDTRAAETGLVDSTAQGLKDSDGTSKDDAALALFVQAENFTVTFSYPGKAGEGADRSLRSFSTSGATAWDADVLILGGLNGAPELVIDELGVIKVLRNITVRDELGSAPLAVGDKITDGDYYVQVVNDGYADVMFVARVALTDRDPDGNEANQNGDTTTRTGTNSNELANGGTTTSPVRWPLFTFRDNFESVTIIDHSVAEMHIVGIDVIYRGSDVPLRAVQLEAQLAADEHDDPVRPVAQPHARGRGRRHPEAAERRQRRRRAQHGGHRRRRRHPQPGRLDADHQHRRRHPLRQRRRLDRDERARPRGHERRRRQRRHGAPQPAARPEREPRCGPERGRRLAASDPAHGGGRRRLVSPHPVRRSRRRARRRDDGADDAARGHDRLDRHRRRREPAAGRERAAGRRPGRREHPRAGRHRDPGVRRAAQHPLPRGQRDAVPRPRRVPRRSDQPARGDRRHVHVRAHARAAGPRARPVRADRARRLRDRPRRHPVRHGRDARHRRRRRHRDRRRPGRRRHDRQRHGGHRPAAHHDRRLHRRPGAPGTSTSTSTAP